MSTKSRSHTTRRSTPSTQGDARRSTGSRSCSRSPWVPRRAISSPSPSTSATGNRHCCSPACIALITIAWRSFGLNPVLSFWTAYILTRPLGASIGDFLSQPKADGGLGLGTTTTSAIFLAAIVAVVLYLTKTKRDQIVIAFEPRRRIGNHRLTARRYRP